MIPFKSLISELTYDVSPHYYWRDGNYQPETAYMLRNAFNAGVRGMYLFETSPESLRRFFKPHPAVFVATAQDEIEANQIHRKVWNLNHTPFLIIQLPNQISVYTGFDYSEGKTARGLIDKAETRGQLKRILSNLKAETIDSGLIWKSEYAKKLNPDKHVDKHLLKNLKTLGQVLSEKSHLKDEVIHALIGKYVYLSYLRARKILTDDWMEKQQIDPASVFSQNATVAGLKKLIEILDDRFNGRIFPINFKKESALEDKYVQWVSTVFSGSDLTKAKNAPDVIVQLHLPFKAYDFESVVSG